MELVSNSKPLIISSNITDKDLLTDGNELKEFSIKDVRKLRKESLLISPTGKIYVYDPEKFTYQILKLMERNHVDLYKVVDMVCCELYCRVMK